MTKSSPKKTFIGQSKFLIQKKCDTNCSKKKKSSSKKFDWSIKFIGQQKKSYPSSRIVDTSSEEEKKI